jgi:hypothetical protein
VESLWINGSFCFLQAGRILWTDREFCNNFFTLVRIRHSAYPQKEALFVDMWITIVDNMPPFKATMN